MAGQQSLQELVMGADQKRCQELELVCWPSIEGADARNGGNSKEMAGIGIGGRQDMGVGQITSKRSVGR